MGIWPPGCSVSMAIRGPQIVKQGWGHPEQFFLSLWNFSYYQVCTIINPLLHSGVNWIGESVSFYCVAHQLIVEIFISFKIMYFEGIFLNKNTNIGIPNVIWESVGGSAIRLKKGQNLVLTVELLLSGKPILTQLKEVTCSKSPSNVFCYKNYGDFFVIQINPWLP